MSLACRACGYAWNQEVYPDRCEIGLAVKMIRGLRCPECGAGHDQLTMSFSDHDPHLPKREAFFRCPLCQRISWNQNDISHKYCGHCHKFFDQPS